MLFPQKERKNNNKKTKGNTVWAAIELGLAGLAIQRGIKAKAKSFLFLCPRRKEKFDFEFLGVVQLDKRFLTIVFIESSLCVVKRSNFLLFLCQTIKLEFFFTGHSFNVVESKNFYNILGFTQLVVHVNKTYSKYT